MAGFREFVTGEVLTAANVNDFLGKQAVMKFADAAARDAALGTAVVSPNALREGMVAYLDDEDLPSFYNGTSWTTEFGGGGLVAVKHALFTGTQTNSTASGADFAVTDLSITHTLADAANRLIISAYFGSAGSSSAVGNVGLTVADDGTPIGVAATEGSRVVVGSGGRSDEGGGPEVVVMPSVTFVYEPGDAAEHTYTVRALNISGNTRTIYINRTQADTNSVSFQRTTSGLVIQEVKV
jgi:hypothetical protein